MSLRRTRARQAIGDTGIGTLTEQDKARVLVRGSGHIAAELQA
jgi:hypothetical protein